LQNEKEGLWGGGARGGYAGIFTGISEGLGLSAKSFYRALKAEKGKRMHAGMEGD